MMRSRVILRTLAILPFALLSAAPRARAATPCPIVNSDVDGNGTLDLFVNGTTVLQTMEINLGQSSAIVYLDCDGNGLYTNSLAGDVNGVDYGVPQTIDLRYIDTVIVRHTEDVSGIARKIGIRVGSKASHVTFEGPGGLLANSSLLVEIDGANGPDTVNFTVPPVVDASSVALRAEMGDANDIVRLTTAGTISNGAVVDIRYGGGAHANYFNWTQTATLTDATLLVDYRGGSSLDVLTFNTAGTIGSGGRLIFEAITGLGNDRYTQNIDLANFDVLAGGQARFSFDGEIGGESVLITRNGTVGGAGTVLDGLLEFAVNGGGGGDTITLDLAGGGFAANGTLRLRLDGGSATDKITADVDIAAGSNPRLDVFVHGAFGGDTLDVGINNGGANTAANYGPAGTVLLDGGWTATDKCILSGNALFHKRNCEL